MILHRLVVDVAPLHSILDVQWKLFVSFDLDMPILVLIPPSLGWLFPSSRQSDVLQHLGP